MSDVLDRVSLIDDAAVSSFDRQRLAIFEALVAELEGPARLTGSDRFAQVIAHARRVLGLSDAQLADLLKVSRPTINRWSRGETTPHAVMAEAVFSVLATTAKTELRRLKKLQ
jgi:ribosome-binding protein aMBF1 (putative translation factor)